MSQYIQPQKLKAGDKAVIISPSGNVDSEYVAGAKKVLESWGLNVWVGKYAENKYGRYAGTVAERLSDLQSAMDDENIKLIFCSRGGYGVVQLLEGIDFSGILKHPKWLIGYSDITALHLAFMQAGIESVHAPMARHLTENGDDEAACHLKDLLFDTIPNYNIEGHHLNRNGDTEGILFGGNLAVLSGLIGTPYMNIPTNGILFIEDIAESPYKIDRMIWNLRLSGILSKLSGLIVGQFTNCNDDPEMKIGIYEAISKMVADYDYPVLFNFPVGHVQKNYPLVQGGKYLLSVNDGQISLKKSL